MNNGINKRSLWTVLDFDFLYVYKQVGDCCMIIFGWPMS